MENINYDNFDLHDIVRKRNDVIDLIHKLQNYVQRLRKHENNLAIKEMGALKGGGFFSDCNCSIYLNQQHLSSRSFGHAIHDRPGCHTALYCTRFKHCICRNHFYC